MTIYPKIDASILKKLGLYYPAAWIASALLLIFKTPKLFSIYSDLEKKLEAQ